MKTTPLISIIYLILLGAFLYYQPNKQSIRGSGDSSGYYSYLPAILIYDDLETLDQSNKVRRSYSNRGSNKTVKLKNGKHLNQYTCGVAILNAPAFFIAHMLAKVSAYPPDGYAWPYFFFINLSGLIYIFIGLYYLSKFLSIYFDSSVVNVTLVTLSLGTNLFFTAVLQSTMAHGYLFCLVSILLWFSHRLKQSSKTKYLYIIAFLLGFITLLRPTVIITGLIPLIIAPQQVWSLLKKGWPLLISTLIAFIPIIPQLLYWKLITGSYVTYSYQDQSFDFLNPHVLDGLFSFKNGWLIYSPIMFAAVFGLLIGIFRKNKIIIGFSALAALHIYIIYSWWCWYYINGFGSRAMIDIYAVLAFPIAYLINKTGKKVVLRIAIYLVFGFLILLNLFMTNQHFKKVLWSEGANRAYYFSIFAQNHLDHQALVALDTDIIQPDDLKFKQSIAKQTFEQDTTAKVDTTLAFSGSKSYCIKPGNKFSNGIKTNLENYKYNASDWLRISAQCLSKGYGTFYNNSHLVISIKRGNEKLLWKSVRINNKIRDSYYSVHNGEINIWKEVYFFIPLRNLKLEPTDQISVYGWNTTKIPVYLDDIKLDVWH